MTVELRPTAPEQTRACNLDQEGYVERDGVHLFYRPVESDRAARTAALIAPLLAEGKGRRPPAPRPRRPTAGS
jgi:hypothetical protein